MSETLNKQVLAWAQLNKLENLVVSPQSLLDATSAVISKVTPLIAEELKDWLLYERHRGDFVDWMPYFTRFPGHEIRASYVNVNPVSPSSNNYLVMRCHGPVVFIDEWDHEKLVRSEDFVE